jgi:organic hydroperoxide reductase OsmC/OhrA
VTVHRYSAGCRWTGTTAVGYERYDRTHSATAPPAELAPALSSDPAFGGDPALLNPEQLVVMAASSCQLLSFLALAARARVDVLAYDDDAEGVMDDADEPARIQSIVLHPRIVVAGGTSEERVRGLVERAHRLCYVANSLRTEIAVEPTVEVG